MQHSLLIKVISILLVILFVEVNIIPTTEGNTEKDEILKTNLNKKEIENNDYQKKFFEIPPYEEWNKTFGGGDFDNCFSIDRTNDAGFILAGRTSSYGSGSMDIWLIKTDSYGNELWNKTFGGADSDWGYMVKETNDQGYIITGGTKSYGAGLEDAWLIKTDSNGNKQWSKTFGGLNYDYSYSVQQTTDGGYALTGFTESNSNGSRDVWLIKTDADGDEIWNKTYGGIEYDFGYSVQQTIDSGYIIAGYTGSYGLGYSDIWLIKTDSYGNELWNKTFGGGDDDFAYCVQQTSDDGFILIGRTWSYGAGLNDAWLIKTDSNGNKQWSKTFGGVSYDYGYSVQQTPDNCFIIAGGTQSFVNGPNADVWLIKTDSNGNELWNKTFGGYGHDKAYSVQYVTNDEYIIAGGDDSFGNNHDAWLIKVASGRRLKTTFIIGRISDLNENNDFLTFKAEKILKIQLFPLRINICKLGEHITITNRYLGILNQNIIFGFFRVPISRKIVRTSCNQIDRRI
jgi:hypothetical protein